jgi:hypothetical protein
MTFALITLHHQYGYLKARGISFPGIRSWNKWGQLSQRVAGCAQDDSSGLWFLSMPHVQNESEAHPASEYVNEQNHEATYSVPSSDKFRKEWNVASRAFRVLYSYLGTELRLYL